MLPTLVTVGMKFPAAPLANEGKTRAEYSDNETYVQIRIRGREFALPIVGVVIGECHVLPSCEGA